MIIIAGVKSSFETLFIFNWKNGEERDKLFFIG